MRKWLFLLLLPVWAQATDFSVTSATTTVDCDTFGGGIGPGDNIILDAGNRGRLVIQDCFGTAASPITIKNDTTDTGPTVIQEPGTAGSGFTFNCVDCEHVVIDGTGKWVGAPAGECGWNDGVEGRTQCGIQIENLGTSSPTLYMRFGGSSSDFTVKGVEVDGSGVSSGPQASCFYVRDASFTLTANPGFWRENIIFEKNYCHDVLGSSHYLGPNTFNDEPPLRNVTVRYSLNLNLGRRGPTIKSGKEGTNAIHDNKVVSTGNNPTTTGGFQHGIFIFEGAGTAYNNYVEDAGEVGIGCFVFEAAGDYASSFDCEIYNNVIVNPGVTGPLAGHGISVGRSSTLLPDYNADIYNNTIVDAAANGINVNNNIGTVAVIQDNIVCNSAGSDISAGSGAAHVTTSNQTGACTSQGFVDYPAIDLHLAAGSSAISGGAYASPPATDIDGVTRPQGAAVDDGAYEFIESGGPGGGGEDITSPKPTSVTIDTGETHYPDYLYIFNEGSGTTVEDEGGATDCDLTISGATWGSDSLGTYLTFDGVNDTAANTTCSALHLAADPMTVCAIVRINSLPADTQAIGGIYDNGDEDQEASLKVRSGGSPQVSVVGTGGGTNFDNNVFTPTIVDGNLKMVCGRMGNTNNDGSVNGSGFDTSSPSLTLVYSGSNVIGVGARQRQTTDQYFAGDVYAFWVYLSSKTDANIATIHGNGNPWPQIGVDPSSGPPPVAQRGNAELIGVQ